jgi:hypothetical protein
LILIINGKLLNQLELEPQRRGSKHSGYSNEGKELPLSLTTERERERKREKERERERERKERNPTMDRLVLVVFFPLSL